MDTLAKGKKNPKQANVSQSGRRIKTGRVMKKQRTTCIWIFLFQLAAIVSVAQEYNLVMDRFQYDHLEHHIQQPGLNLHTAFKPFRISDIKKVTDPDTMYGIHDPKGKFARSWVGKRIFREHFLSLDSSAFQLYIDPLFAFDIGRDLLVDRNTYTNSRGLQLMGNIGKQVSFYTCLWENQSRFVNYVDSFVTRQNVVPSQGRVKPFGTGGYDYAWVSGYISYTPSRFFNFQAGNDRQFVGDGYRSLLLSDNAFNFPFLKLTTTFWKLRYTNLFTAFQNVGSAANSGLGGYQKKYASFHHLSLNLGKRFNIGLFEAVVWQSVDTAGQRRNFDVNYFNPVIFFRPLEFSLGSPDNVLLGLNMKLIFMKRNIVYGQLMLDEFSLKEMRARKGWWGNKYGFQLGVKVFNILHQPGLSLQSEFNLVRPYTYGHSAATQSYTHFAQSLAHPLGANFIESVNFLRYRIRRFALEAKLQAMRYGADTTNASGANSNVGQNIFLATSETFNQPNSVPAIYGNRTLQGLLNTIVFADLTISYIINRKTNMRMELCLSRRMQSNERTSVHTNWIFFGFRTTLPNRYYDF
jgi:hypothetical protein